MASASANSPMIPAPYARTRRPPSRSAKPSRAPTGTRACRPCGTSPAASRPRRYTVCPAIIVKFRRFATTKTTNTATAAPPSSAIPRSARPQRTSAPTTGKHAYVARLLSRYRTHACARGWRRPPRTRCPWRRPARGRAAPSPARGRGTSRRSGTASRGASGSRCRRRARRASRRGRTPPTAPPWTAARSPRPSRRGRTTHTIIRFRSRSRPSVGRARGAGRSGSGRCRRSRSFVLATRMRASDHTTIRPTGRRPARRSRAQGKPYEQRGQPVTRLGKFAWGPDRIKIRFASPFIEGAYRAVCR